MHPTILENPKGAQTSRRPSSPSAADYKGKGIAKADDASGSPGTTGKSLKCSWGTCSLSEGSEFSLLSHVDSHIERAISSVCPFKGMSDTLGPPPFPFGQGMAGRPF